MEDVYSTEDLELLQGKSELEGVQSIEDLELALG